MTHLFIRYSRDEARIGATRAAKVLAGAMKNHEIFWDAFR
jgi:hypothetical protein